jgi:hypothetical protein
MTRRELILGHLMLARNDPALASMRDCGLFDDLAALHARSHGESVCGAVSAGWIGPSTVRICYDTDDQSSPTRSATAEVGPSPRNDLQHASPTDYFVPER